MSFDSFGYNGAIELSQELVHRIVASELYERNLVVENGTLANEDMVPVPVDLGGGISITAYLLLGRPEVELTDHDGNNGLDLTIPMFGVGLFQRESGRSPVQQIDTGLVGGGFTIGVKVHDIRVAGAGGSLSLDLTRVTDKSIEIVDFLFAEKPTHVGGIATLAGTLADKDLDALLAGAGVTLTAANLRGAIAAAVTSGKIPVKPFPINPANDHPELGQWDLMAFDGPGAGAVIELYDAAGQQQGVRTDGHDVIPNGPPPRYGWAGELRADIVIGLFDAALDKADYFKQVSGLNTSTNALGFMVVPSNDKRTYSLPGHVDCVTVNAPDKGNVNIEVIAGLGGLSRGRIRLLGPDTDTSFRADDKGSFTTSVKASAGDRLAMIVDAVPLPGHPDALLWRPKLSLQDGNVRFDFHYWKDWLCDLDFEGDGMIVAELRADRTAPFKLSAKVMDSDLEMPLWLWAVGFFGGAAVPLLDWVVGAVIAETLIVTVLKDYAIGEVNPQEAVDGKIGAFNDNLPQISVPNAALFLDDVLVSSDGLLLAGRADAGRFTASGRLAVPSLSNGVVAWGKDFHGAFDWEPSASAIEVKARGFSAVAEGDAPSNFWAVNFDDIPHLPFAAQVTHNLGPGESVTFFVDNPETIGKVLLERPIDPETRIAGQVIVTWIAYRKRVAVRARIVNEVQAIRVGGSESLTLIIDEYRYSGELTLDLTKFFLSNDTADAGLEHWFWDGAEVTAGGIAFSGGSVSLRPYDHALWVEIDQSGYPATELGPNFHTIRFTGTDVFGRKVDITYLLQVPPRTLRPKPIAERPGLGTWVNPLSDPLRRPIDLVSTEVLSMLGANPAADGLAQTLVSAIKNGSASLNQSDALAALQILRNGVHDLK